MGDIQKVIIGVFAVMTTAAYLAWLITRWIMGRGASSQTLRARKVRVANPVAPPADTHPGLAISSAWAARWWSSGTLFFNMTLYLLEWDNGLDFDDHTVTLLGIYTSAEKRLAGKAALDGLKCWPFNKDGRFVEGEVESDTDLGFRGWEQKV